MTVEDSLGALARIEPTALRLAEVASLAVELEPALLRRLRRSLVPEASPLAEALLWSSPLASASTPSSLLIRDDALTHLRERLGEDQDLLDAARAIVEASHRGSPEILRCEEELVYLGLVDVEKKPRPGVDHSVLEVRVRARLEQVMRSIAAEPDRRESLLAWSSRALPTLPARVQTADAYAALAALTSAGAPVSGQAWSAVFPPGERDVRVGVRWTSQGLVLSAQEGGEVELRLPPIQPSLVEVKFLEGEHRGEVARVVVPVEGPVTLALGADVKVLRVSSLRGDGLLLRRQIGLKGRISAVPRFSGPWVLVAGTAQYALHPLEAGAAEQLGAALAEHGCGVITGAFQGVDHIVSRAFVERLAFLTGNASERLVRKRLMRVVQRGRAPDFPQGVLHRVDGLAEEYWLPIERAIAVVVIGDAAGTREVALTAGRAGRPVFAYPGTRAESLPGVSNVSHEGSAQESSAANRIVQSILRHAATPSETSQWAGEELMTLAIRYLRPQPLRVSDALAHRLLKGIPLRTKKVGTPVPESAFQSPSPPERVLRYLATQLSPESSHLPLLLKALKHELMDAARFFSETRPLWQGLKAIERLLAEPELPNEPASSTYALQLQELLGVLERESHLDEGGECKALLRRVIPKASGTDLEELASQYEDLRRTHHGGIERTELMTSVVAEVRHAASRLEIEGSRITRMYETGRAGLRVVALACCIARPGQAPAHVVVDALRAPRTPFEQWVALEAVDAILKSAEMGRAERCVAATLAALEDSHNIIHDRDDASRRRFANAILGQYAARAGLPRPVNAEALRLWFSGSVRHGVKGRPCVAVLGSSNFSARFTLGYALGERLAAYGWRLAIGRGQDVGPAVIAGFRLRDGTDYTVYTTSHSETDGDAERTRVFTSQADARRQMIANASCCLVLGGGRGALEECEMATRAGLPILAVTHTGGAAHAVTAPTRHALRATLGLPDWFLGLMDTPGPDEEAAECIVRVLNVVARRLEERRVPAKPGRRASAHAVKHAAPGSVETGTKVSKPARPAAPPSTQLRATQKLVAAKTAPKSTARGKATKTSAPTAARKTPPTNTKGRKK